MKIILVTSIILLLTTFTCSYSQIPAFPGAEGFGSFTAGGRGGKVIKVTNTNDNGPGSLRAAVEAEGARIVVFDVGGIINLETELSVRNPYLTIAGQSAPGDGICIRGECLRIYTHDVVVRHIRSRPGDIDFGPSNDWESIDAISINGNAHNVIIDHCSLSWAVDENIDVWERAHDITIQNCIISQALNHSKHPKGSHGMGMIIGSKTTNISIHHNIFAHNNDRNPHINGPAFVDFRNNLIYNPGGVAIDIGARNGQAFNFVNNFVKKGPHTNIPAEVIVRNLGRQTSHVYQAGNVGVKGEFNIKYYSDNARSKTLLQTKDSAQLSSVIMAKPIDAPSVTTLSAENAYGYVLQHAGATLPRRDAVDREVINTINKGRGGMVNSKNQILEWPPFQKGIAFADSDGDGMPDHWEENFQLDPLLNDSHEDADKDGYTNIEEYLNSTDPTQSESSQSTAMMPLGLSTTDLVVYPDLEFELEQNYPNPYDSITNIKFSIDRPANVVIKVVDNEGKEVALLVNGYLYEGRYHVLWDASNINPGVYHIYMTSNKKVRSVRSVISR